MAEKQGWRVSISLTAVGIVGALCGYSLQHFYSLKRERSSAFEKRQSAAYVDFLNAFEKHRIGREASKAGKRQRADKLDEEFQLEAGSAARRIAVFGDNKVVKAMADWYRSYGSGSCQDQLNAELEMWEKMRDALARRTSES